MPSYIDLNDTDPAAPSGKQNVKWQSNFTHFGDFNDPEPVSAYMQDATNVATGAILISGDLGGNATSPQVVGFRSVPLDTPSPVDGDVYRYSSSAGKFILVAIGSGGTAGNPWGMLSPSTINPPDPASFTWINQGSATAALDSTGGCYFFAPGVTSNNLRILKETAPSTPYSRIVGFATALQRDFMAVGIIFRESSTGKVVFFAADGGAANVARLSYNQWTNATAYSSTPLATNSQPWCVLVWLKVTDDGTDLVWYTSPDGINWIQAHTVSRTIWMSGGPDEVGFAIQMGNGNNPGAAKFIHWE